MNISESHLLTLLLLANGLLLAIAAIAIARFCREFGRMRRFWSSPTGAAISDSAEQQERQQLLVNLRLERRLNHMQQKIEALGTAAPQASAESQRLLPIDNAIRMAKSGASVEDLTKSCGLNIGEATLMRTMHSPPPSAQAN